MKTLPRLYLWIAVLTTLAWTCLPLFAFPQDRDQIGSDGHPGHRELTEDAARSLRLSESATRILTLGATDPDARDWDPPAAHAQTANNEDGMPTQTAEQARESLLGYLQGKAGEVRRELNAGHRDRALYLLGYALHALQDLSAHEGITNAEHSFLADEGQSPDHDERRYDRAEQWTREFLTAVSQALGADWYRLSEFRGEAPTEDELDALIGTGRERTLGKLKEYADLADKFKDLPERTRSVRWDDPEDLQNEALEAFVAALGGEVLFLLDRGAYHVGDGAFENTADKAIVASNALVGEWYSLSFSVNAAATVKVRIGALYGLDFGHGGRVIMDGNRVGGLDAGHNHSSFASDAVGLGAGSHRLAICSNIRKTGDKKHPFDADDFVFVRVSVQGKLRGISVKPLGQGLVSPEHLQPLTDNFQNPATGLPQWSEPHAEVGYASGEYHIAARRAHTLVAVPIEHKFENFDLTVTARKVAGSDRNAFGVAFGVDEGELSRFLISSDGTFRTDSPNEPGREPRPSPAVKRGPEANSLRVIAFGPEMGFWVNGQMVARRKDPERTVGYVWLVGGTAGGDSARVGFQDLQVTPLTERPPELSGVLPGLRTQANPIDGAEMVFVPAGKFLLGSDDVTWAQPAQEVHVDGYWMYRYEVTNEQFAQFVQATGYSAQGNWRQYYKAGKEKHPVVGVTWHDAAAYARWAGGRLPTEAEWEKAARGPDGRKWAWGEEASAPRANLAERLGKTAPVGSFSEDLSPYGCLDLTGNVREWTASLFAPYATGEFRRQGEGDGERAVRGGCWRNSLTSAQSASRDRGKPGMGDETRGFRCVLPE